jgi:hypothetical protein
MSSTLIVRMEGVNFASFIYDCEKLPVIRGGGLILHEAPREFEKWLRTQPGVAGVEAISLGSSGGLFKIPWDGRTAEQANALREDAEQWLREDGNRRFATFVVDVELDPEASWEAVRERALARNRLRQMQAPRLAYPAPPLDAPEGRAVCETDRIRPGRPESDSVKARADFGRKRKQSFYKREAGVELGPFVQDFDTLTKKAGHLLTNKMAILSLDGNGFGNIQGNLASSEALKEWDEKLRRYRSELLRGFLERARSEKGKLDWVNGDEVRMEVLLWGGDDMRFVFPAWVGWQAVRSSKKFPAIGPTTDKL